MHLVDEQVAVPVQKSRDDAVPGGEVGQPSQGAHGDEDDIERIIEARVDVVDVCPDELGPATGESGEALGLVDERVGDVETDRPRCAQVPLDGDELTPVVAGELCHRAAFHSDPVEDALLDVVQRPELRVGERLPKAFELLTLVHGSGLVPHAPVQLAELLAFLGPIVGQSPGVVRVAGQLAHVHLESALWTGSRGSLLEVLLVEVVQVQLDGRPVPVVIDGGAVGTQNLDLLYGRSHS